MGNLKQSIFAGIFSIFTIGILTFLTYKTELGIFLLASFGSSMVLIYGYPESPFAKPKNVFFWSLNNSSCWFDFFKYLIFASLYCYSYSCRLRSFFDDFV